MITLQEIQMKLAESIKQSGLTQTEIAKRIGVKQSQVSCYLHGKKMPALDTFANLCIVLDIDPAEMLCVDKNK